jgi:hypothetical protein
MDLLSKSKSDEHGNRIYLLEDYPDEPFEEDQVGENFVFSICKRYFGEELDSADQQLFDTTLAGFKYKKVVKGAARNNPPQQKANGSKPWWKFW